MNAPAKPIKIVTVIGARPQIIKASTISRVIKEHYAGQIEEVVVHTGQHYDDSMSAVFYRELGIEPENYNLGTGSGSHAAQTAKMMIALEEILLKEKPDYLLLYGDTNSTLAGAVVAAKMHIKVIHIEAGVRCENKTNPEELNRIVCDHYSTLLFYYTPSGADYLVKEGFNLANKAPFSINHQGCFQCGDIMYDNSLHFAKQGKAQCAILSDLELKNQQFVLATVHRDVNTDIPERLHSIMEGLCQVSAHIPVLLPLHPRTSKILDTPTHADTKLLLEAHPNMKILPPAGYLDMLALESDATMIFTDSGGVQREAFFFQKPCAVLSEETAWHELLSTGSTLLTAHHADKIYNAWLELGASNKSFEWPPIFGNGTAAEFIVKTLWEQHAAS